MPERQLYDLCFTHLGDAISKSSAHLDLEHDDRRIHDLIIGAMARAGHNVRDIDAWAVQVCNPANGHVLRTFVTTAEPGDEKRLG